MKSVLVLVSLIALAACQVGFVGNATVQNPGQYAYRDIDVTVLNVPNVVEGAFFTTVSTVNGTNQRDVVAGSFYVFTFDNLPPTASVSFFDQFSTYQKNQGMGNTLFNFNAQEATSFVAKVFTSLEEVNTTNNITVKTVSLANDITWVLTSNTPTVNGLLQSVTLKGTNAQLGANFSISITTVFSQILGLLNVVGTPVITPKSLETIVNIQNYPYQNKANALRLNLVVGTATASISIQGTVTITTGNGTSAGYVRISDQVQVDGNVKTATITVVSQTQNGKMGSTYVDAQITAKYQNQFQVTQVAVQFPAGAASITFDPTAGAGAPPPLVTGTYTGTNPNPNPTGNNNSQGRITPILALLFLLVVILI